MGPGAQSLAFPFEFRENAKIKNAKYVSRNRIYELQRLSVHHAESGAPGVMAPQDFI